MTTRNQARGPFRGGSPQLAPSCHLPRPMIPSPSPPRRSVHRIMVKPAEAGQGPPLATGRSLPHPSPLPLGEGEASSAFDESEPFGWSGSGRTGSLSQRERVGVRENGSALFIRQLCYTPSSPNGAAHTSPGHRPGCPRRDTKALKGRPIGRASSPMARPFRAGFHLLTQPRASLRFALGWHDAAPLGLNTAPGASSPASRPPERFGFTTRCRPFSLSQRVCFRISNDFSVF